MINKKIKKVLVIGSGPIVIGQAAEFDYSGSQALQILKSYGIETVLINPNPATIMTDESMADHIYLEPLTLEFVKKIIIKENPDGVLASFGGQTALNLAKELVESNFLKRENCELLGSSIEAIILSEDRFLFREKMISENINVPSGLIIANIDDGVNWAETNGYPVIIRPAYTLGGSGGGIANNKIELQKILKRGLRLSTIGQCLIESSIKGLKEIEFEIIRDHNDNCVSICHMENIDPVGIHTGESIVIAPIQSLTDKEIQQLRTLCFKVVRSLNIIGACNVQLAQDPDSSEYFVIEANPRVSRSSALASKATGYPIAKISTHVSLGKSLDEIINPITGKTFASFEPTLDYVICKIPRWPFDKFKTANRSLSTQMKSTGEVMSIGRTFEEAFLKGLRSLELKNATEYYQSFNHRKTDELILDLKKHTDNWFLELMELFRRDLTIEKAHEITEIDPYFLYRIQSIILKEKELANLKDLNRDTLYLLKKSGFTNKAISYFSNISIYEIQLLLEKYSIKPVIKSVDSCAAEFEAITPYYYQTYDQESDAVQSLNKKVIILGSGPIRIGQGIEFDYSCVHSILAAKEMGFETVMINNNPETCSTDFSLSDRLYFEPLDTEDVINILKFEKPTGVIVQFGGQTAINLAADIEMAGFKILGTNLENINQAENRSDFEALLDHLTIRRPKACLLRSINDLTDCLKKITFPVIARPSYVLGGMQMEVLYNRDELEQYLKMDLEISNEKPILIDEYIKGKEIEVDAISDGEEVFIPGIMEHIERAGIHSGDSISVYPPQNLYPEVIKEVTETTIKIARALKIKGILNIQFTYKKGELYILEVNPRASRTVPFLSKMTKIPMANIATQIILGRKLKDFGYQTEVAPTPDFVSVKVPVFSFDKLSDVEPALGPEMKSTGEAIGVGPKLEIALYKGLLAQGIKLPETGRVLLTISDRYKKDIVEIAEAFSNLGFKIVATSGTAIFLNEQTNIGVLEVSKIEESEYSLINMINDKKVDLIINTLSKDKKSNTDGFKMRRAALENNIPCFTSLDTVNAILKIYLHRQLDLWKL